MSLRHLFFSLCLSVSALSPLAAFAQPEPSMYGDRVKADVKLQYVYTLDEALARARAEKKPIFFNCFADWAIPCHGMNKYVFSDAEFADYMNRNFVNLYIDVSKRGNAAVAKRYDIRRFAHFLVLDADGNVLLRIVGGKKLPEFKEDVMRALSPKTSLPGLEAAYKKGKRDKKTLLDYLYDLNLADDKEQFDKVAQEYVAALKPKDYAKSENWFVVSKLITDRESPLFKHLLDNKDEFVKNNGQKVNDFVESLFYAEAAGYAAGSTPYNADAVLGMQIDARRANIPDTSVVYVACKLAQLRGEKRIGELLDYMRAKGDAFRFDRASYELTFDFPDMTAEQTKQVVAYLREAATRNTGEAAKRLGFLADRLEKHDGVNFEQLSLKDALAKAAKEGKQVFVDCYTSWCGPCKKLAREVFPQPEVGKVLNARFVNLQIDMEKGEGPAVSKQFGINSFPTMLILNPDGTKVGSIVGYFPTERLLDEIAKVPTR